jgi:hypothetical protein
MVFQIRDAHPELDVTPMKNGNKVQIPAYSEMAVSPNTYGNKVQYSASRDGNKPIKDWRQSHSLGSISLKPILRVNKSFLFKDWSYLQSHITNGGG